MIVSVEAHAETAVADQSELDKWSLSEAKQLAILQCVDNGRVSTNSLMWQVPALTLTAQAFLLTIALNPNTQPTGRAIAAGIGLIIVSATYQLFLRHRHIEVTRAEWLAAFECRFGLPPIHKRGALDDPEFPWSLEAEPCLEPRTQHAPSAAQTQQKMGPRLHLRSSFNIWRRALTLLAVADVGLLVLAILELTHTCDVLAA